MRLSPAAKVTRGVADFRSAGTAPAAVVPVLWAAIAAAVGALAWIRQAHPAGALDIAPDPPLMSQSIVARAQRMSGCNSLWARMSTAAGAPDRSGRPRRSLACVGPDPGLAEPRADDPD